MTKAIDPTLGPGGDGKQCSKCKEWKHRSEFHYSSKSKSKMSSACIECDREKGRAYYLANTERVLARTKRLREENPERKKANSRAWYERNRERRYARSKAWRQANPERSREYGQRHHKKNPGAARERNRKRSSTPAGKLERAIRARVWKGLISGGKVDKTFRALGYTPQDLREHLEKQFSPGMTWDNYGHRGWHVDHIIPLSAFNYEKTTDIDFKRAWALKNLRPLWADENLRKSNRLEKEFQPSFAF
ncbi:MAG: hypothetical protein FD152_776 [Xanthobacteraceae bacterium]|nr:MAG: hypothetical protein FD152_776 [Xanthobacteraceae bacterium]